MRPVQRGFDGVLFGMIGAQPGTQKALWDGRLWTGSLAFSGAYQVHVVATNSIGTVSLVAPFSARR